MGPFGQDGHRRAFSQVQGPFACSALTPGENGEGAGGSLGESSDCDMSLTPGEEERGGRKVDWKHPRALCCSKRI